MIFWFVLVYFCKASDFWSSGVIEKELIKSSSSSSVSSSKFRLFENFFGSIKEVEEFDNFIQVTLPINDQSERILFVTPEITKKNPEGVKETFFRFYCSVVGVLLRGKEVNKFTRRTPDQSREILRRCLEEFEEILGVKLVTGMIDFGPDGLSLPLQQEFHDREMTLFRHPLNMIEGTSIYYVTPSLPRTLTIHGCCKWSRDENLKRKKIFRVMAKYSPNIRLSTIADDYNEVVEQLENIYGPLEDVALSDSSGISTSHSSDIENSATANSYATANVTGDTGDIEMKIIQKNEEGEDEDD